MKSRTFGPFGGWGYIWCLAGLAAMATGCVERRVVYVPVYQSSPSYYATQPPPASGPAVAGAAVGTNAPAGPVIINQAPPQPQVEIVPVAPGPDYVWAPGYWGWNGTWIWIGGGWAIRPHPGAVWVGGHWGRQGRGYIWMGGHWR